MLKSSPALAIEAQEHSDNTESSRYKKLSQKHAESVIGYLRKINIAGSCLTALGFGEENTKADNNTNDERAKN